MVLQRRNSNSSIDHQSRLLRSQQEASSSLNQSQPGSSYGSTRIAPRGRHKQTLQAISDQDSNISENETDDPYEHYESDGRSASIPSSYTDSIFSEDDEIPVTVKDEVINIIRSATPLCVTSFFEYLLAVNSLFMIGHLGSRELGSASLAVLVFNISGMAVIEGMSTSLDTFCSQAFGARKYHKVGLYFQRCTAMIFTLLLPIMGTWWWSKHILKHVVAEADLLDLTQPYLRILCFGTPGLIAFETGKRFLQSQRIFHASTYVLFFCMPLNILLNYFFIKYWGFIGAPYALVATYWIMAFLLLAYVAFVDGKQCWNGLSKRAFRHWKPMLNLAIPGLIMIESEYLSFEVLTIMASYFGTESLAAQTIISNIGSLWYQFPFAIGCAISTRVAIYVGMGSQRSSRVSVRIAYVVAAFTALISFILITSLKYPLTLLFTSEDEVIRLSVKSMPILAFNQFGDTFNIISAGILRSQGRQKIGSYLNIIAYYGVALPFSYLFAFYFELEITGLWLGLMMGVFILGISETFYVYKSNWDQILKEALDRDEDEYEVLIDDDSTVSSFVTSYE
ncbi:Multidrug and toxin extrusion protein 1 [Wickerhamomyces ciferrii]|uniref:Multidrug and toxin extrusion protein 1 n=1 Tax=Wickerhamomyces ciferrii (strain ATCC 14091 / BCRC 22168 / CBS 111 / JCM 3599 / NBRC 0793 / NRRL Y-1031 F-60-10) TaxID=1206466 RepID=K0KI74_WICCF|nr:Multidrug and toxin extrusion protein 1 [Wickerhamomyces ciferrii]CCH40843.1 Multidrug and toxin extrusion protein 1 [Wickerhamomyces ciferrii]